MKNKKLIAAILLIDALVLAGFIIQYYWSKSELLDLTEVPMYVMLIALGYIIIQILKRNIIKGKNWWDWLYYVGLTSILVPLIWATVGNLEIFNVITDYGSLFFAIPVLLDIKLMLTKSEE